MTIEFVWFTGEEAGLLGSREYARQGNAEGKNVADALNNDMAGYANDDRLDNTIRYSSAVVPDIQHAAALLFTDLIFYDAHCYKSTDAHALYDAFGDVIGGIGPIRSAPTRTTIGSTTCSRRSNSGWWRRWRRHR